MGETIGYQQAVMGAAGLAAKDKTLPVPLPQGEPLVPEKTETQKIAHGDLQVLMAAVINLNAWPSGSL